MNKRREELTMSFEKQVLVKVIVPEERMGQVVGKGHANQDRIARKYGVKVILPARGGNEVELRGPADRVAAARWDILDHLIIEQEYRLESHHVGAIIGRKGATINSLRRDHRVNIYFKNERVFISGTPQDCEDAWSSIKSIVAKIGN